MADEDDNDLGAFQPPEYLTKRAKKIFRQLMRVLGPDAKESDLSLYCDYSQGCADVEKLTGEVDKEGFTVVTDCGVKANPKAQLLTVTRAQVAALRRDLNLTPKARSEKNAKKGVKPFGGL